MANANKLTISKIVADLQKRKAQLELQLKRINQQLDALQSVVRDYLPESEPNSQTQETPKQSIREILELLAYANQGVVEVSEAKRHLVNTGRFDTEAAAGTAIGPVLSNKKLFTRLDRGKYKSINATTTLIKEEFADIEPESEAKF